MRQDALANGELRRVGSIETIYTVDPDEAGLEATLLMTFDPHLLTVTLATQEYTRPSDYRTRYRR